MVIPVTGATCPMFAPDSPGTGAGRTRLHGGRRAVHHPPLAVGRVGSRDPGLTRSAQPSVSQPQSDGPLLPPPTPTHGTARHSTDTAPSGTRHGTAPGNTARHGTARSGTAGWSTTRSSTVWTSAIRHSHQVARNSKGATQHVAA